MSKLMYFLLRFFARLQKFDFKNFKYRNSYHPSIISGTRGRRTSSIKRMQAVVNEIGGNGNSILDIGCAEGLFSLELARSGSTVIGIEGKLSRVIQAYADAAKENLRNVTFFNANADEHFLSGLPKFNYILLLAVWHHMVRRNSLEDATIMLKIIWQKCEDGLVFETGLTELSENFGLKGWDEEKLLKYLQDELKPTCISELGRFKSFDASAFQSSKEKADGEFERPIYLLKK